MKHLILFDIDYTLFDTDKFRDLTYPKLMQLLEQEDTPEYHTKVKEVEKSLIKKAGYEPVAFAKELMEVLRIQPKHEEIEKLFYNEKLYKECLYPEVHEVLLSLSKNPDILLGIVSQGTVSFQERKIASIRHFFKEQFIYIALHKIGMTSDIASETKEFSLTVVDDSAPFLDALKKTVSTATTILVAKENRYEKRPTPEGFKPDYTVMSLSEVLKKFDRDDTV